MVLHFHNTIIQLSLIQNLPLFFTIIRTVAKLTTSTNSKLACSSLNVEKSKVYYFYLLYNNLSVRFEQGIKSSFYGTYIYRFLVGVVLYRMECFLWVKITQRLYWSIEYTYFNTHKWFNIIVLYSINTIMFPKIVFLLKKKYWKVIYMLLNYVHIYVKYINYFIVKNILWLI